MVAELKFEHLKGLEYLIKFNSPIRGASIDANLIGYIVNLIDYDLVKRTKKQDKEMPNEIRDYYEATPLGKEFYNSIMNYVKKKISTINSD